MAIQPTMNFQLPLLPQPIRSGGMANATKRRGRRSFSRVYCLTAQGWGLDEGLGRNDTWRVAWDGA